MQATSEMNKFTRKTPRDEYEEDDEDDDGEARLGDGSGRAVEATNSKVREHRKKQKRDKAQKKQDAERAKEDKKDRRIQLDSWLQSEGLAKTASGKLPLKDAVVQGYIGDG